MFSENGQQPGFLETYTNSAVCFTKSATTSAANIRHIGDFAGLTSAVTLSLKKRICLPNSARI